MSARSSCLVPFSCLRSFFYPFIIFVHSLIELELSLAFLHCSSTTCKLATSPFQTTRDIIDRHKRLKRLKRLHLHFRTFTSHWSLQVCTAPLNYSSYTSPFEKDKGQLSLIFSILFPNPIRNQWKSNEINAWCIGVYNLDSRHNIAQRQSPLTAPLWTSRDKSYKRITRRTRPARGRLRVDRSEQSELRDRFPHAFSQGVTAASDGKLRPLVGNVDLGRLQGPETEWHRHKNLFHIL